ncbi:redoxin domain-containing protein [Mucilaginibacter aquariorum]|uniref:Redoxin domain-containing protein n=1 Tax=Mucilaginibacter aquariorum TaxID=2967225 RepID=A0ABT1T947_9SPHI|nr:redoxin domain-containing protein [Mucilaginibacter aquariorum]MCQ6961126.1 redoxin domain-containing protein [Mucilaginibacter aquariorum]
MPLIEYQQAPDFQATDIFGNPVSISALKGKKILLSFYRHVACPFTNLRFLELQELDSYFSEMGLFVLAVYESSSKNLQKFAYDEAFYARMIANPEYDLYSLYDIEQSTLKVLYSMYMGAYAKSQEGQRRFKKSFCPEGRKNTLGGDFLIGEDGEIKYAYYNQYLGDHLPVKDIIRFLNNDKIEISRRYC